MKKKKKLSGGDICFCLSWIISISILVFRGVTAHNTEKEIDEHIRTAKNNAVEYLNEKYGFEAEIIQSEAEKFPEGFNKKCDVLRMTAKGGGKTFDVVAHTMEKSDECADSYQIEEIKQAFLNDICRDYSDFYPLTLYFDTTSVKDNTYGYSFKNQFRNYFDGNNLDKLLEELISGQVIIICNNEKFDNDDIFEKIKQLGMTAVFVSVDDKNILNEMCNIEKAEFEDIIKYEPYINNSRAITHAYDEVKKQIIVYDKKDTVVAKKTEDLLYSSYAEGVYAYYNFYKRNPNGISMEKVESGGVRENFKIINKDYVKYFASPLTGEYTFSNAGRSEVYVYYPLENFKGKDKNKISAAWFGYGGEINYYNIEECSIVGDYAVFRIPYNAKYFIILDCSGQEDFVPQWAVEK